jgi:hypothetical protein
MSRIRGHPLRESKIRKYVDTRFKPGEQFRASDIAKPLNLTSTEVGNALKFIETIRIAYHTCGTGAVWEKMDYV